MAYTNSNPNSNTVAPTGFAAQAAAAANLAAPAPPPPPVVQEVRRTGWIEKYSVGRGILPIKNWQRRWFSVDNHGLNYSKSQFEPPAKRTYIPFVTSTTSRDVFMNPVFLFPNVTKDIHSEACEPGVFYFALRFEENRVSRVLLLRTRVQEDRDSWVRYLAQYVHAAALTTGGVPAYHPLSTTGQKKGFDPDELDAKEKKALRQVVLDWDEGAQLRASGPGAVPDPIMEAAAQNAQLSLNDASNWGDDFDDEPPDPFGGGQVVAQKGGGGGGAIGGAGAGANVRNRGKSTATNIAAMDDLL